MVTDTVIGADTGADIVRGTDTAIVTGAGAELGSEAVGIVVGIAERVCARISASV
jgi:hypothetical protein